MILVDTSVWINHLRWGDSHLVSLLNDGKVMVHPFVVGELSSGQLKNRKNILELLNALPMATVAEHAETLLLVDSRKLYGKGLGWIDLHLLASALISECKLWTTDKRLAEAASKLGLIEKEANRRTNTK